MSDVGTLRKYGVKNPKEITLAQKLSIAKYLSDKLVPNLKPVEIGESGDWEPNKIASDSADEKRNQLQVYIPSVKKSVQIEATDEEVVEIEREGVDKYIERHPELVDMDDGHEAKFVWEVPNE
jgi:hypothetical protein